MTTPVAVTTRVRFSSDELRDVRKPAKATLLCADPFNKAKIIPSCDWFTESYLLTEDKTSSHDPTDSYQMPHRRPPAACFPPRARGLSGNPGGGRCPPARSTNGTGIGHNMTPATTFPRGLSKGGDAYESPEGKQLWDFFFLQGPKGKVAQSKCRDGTHVPTRPYGCETQGPGLGPPVRDTAGQNTGQQVRWLAWKGLQVTRGPAAGPHRPYLKGTPASSTFYFNDRPTL